jgi:hypothetical protein
LRNGDDGALMICTCKSCNHVDHGQSRADDQDAIRSPYDRQRVRRPRSRDKSGMARGALSDGTRSTRHMASANRDPIGAKRGSIRKLEAEPIVIADQLDDPRLAMTQRGRRRASRCLCESRLRVSCKRVPWDKTASKRISAFRVRQPFVIKEPAGEVGRIRTEQRHPITWDVDAMIRICRSVSCASPQLCRWLDHIDRKWLRGRG